MNKKIGAATHDDVPEICEFLDGAFPSVSASEWRIIIESPWETEHPDYGFVIKVDDRVVGYQGAMYSRRIIDGREEKFCNLFGWAIDEAYRKQAFFLAKKFLSRPGYHETALSSRPEQVPIWRRLGYQTLDEYRQVFMPRPFVGQLLQGPLPEMVAPEIATAHLDYDDARVVRDHIGLDCDIVVFRHRDDHCVVITKRVYVDIGQAGRIQRLEPWLSRSLTTPGIGRFSRHLKNWGDGTGPCAEVLYVSDKGLFQQFFDYFILRICIAQKVLGLTCDQRFLGLGPPYRSDLPSRYMYRSDSLDPSQLDGIYSELMFLD